MIVKDILRDLARQFEDAQLYFGHGTETAFDEAVYLVFTICHIPFDGDESVYEQDISEQNFRVIIDLANQRVKTRKPMAYLLGEAWFCGYPFIVNEDVLVPRSPIAELIQQQYTPWVQPEQLNRVLDLCTGSGCIAIATALEMPWVDVVGSDISSEALTVAKQNTAKYNLYERVQLVQSDVFEHVEGQFDLIVSNPPYVDAHDIAAMPEEYRREPADLALASGHDGLDCTRRILSEAAQYLTDDGVLIVEVGNSQVALAEAFPELPFTWLEFEFGGQGVFVLHRSDLC